MSTEDIIRGYPEHDGEEYASPYNMPPRRRRRDRLVREPCPVSLPADTGVSRTTVEAWRSAHLDAVHLRCRGVDSSSDPEIVAKAVAEGRIVLTFDLDLGEILAAAQSRAPSVLIFRLRNQTAVAVNPRLFRVIEHCAPGARDRSDGFIEDDGFRVRRLPIRP